MADEGYLAEFVRDKLPVLKAFGPVLPVWRHLIFRPETFFETVRTIPHLSAKNAIVFSLSSATLITAALVSADEVFELVAEYVLETPYKPLNLLQEFSL